MAGIIISVVFIVFVLARVLLGKEDGFGGDSTDGSSSGRSRRRRADDDEKYPPSYY